MEQRLFVAACVMYIFSWISKFLFRRNKLDSSFAFGLWNAAFLFLIFGAAYYVISFIIQSGASSSGLDSGVNFKQMVIFTAIAAVSVCGFFSARKKDAEKRQPLIKSNMDWANTVYFAGFVASFVMFFFAQAFKIPSPSMEKTLLVGDHLFVNKAAYGFRVPFTQKRFLELSEIKKGDVIVFSFPADSPQQINCGGYQYGRDYVKRVVAMPGDEVKVQNGELFVNGVKEPFHGYEQYEPVERLVSLREFPQDVYQKIWEDRRLEHEYGLSLRDDFGPVIVPENSYFAMGDNRDNSCDSRFWGPVPRQNIKGTVWFIHWPLSRMQKVK